VNQLGVGSFFLDTMEIKASSGSTAIRAILHLAARDKLSKTQWLCDDITQTDIEEV
jgi:hypothetical protein